MDVTRDFAELVRQHIGWVHGVARRRLGDAPLAEDVTQAVFILLYRKAPAFAGERSLVAWLHRTTKYAAEVADRQRRRRKRHETEAAVQRAHVNNSEAANEWAELAPLLDRMIDRLGREDREAILLRFYRQMTFTEVAAAMGSTEEAVRKRVTRALEKLRTSAAARGLTMTTAALAASLDVEGATGAAAPPGLVATSMTAALASSGSALTAASIPIAKGATTMMFLAKAKIAAAVALAVIVTGGATVALMAAPTTRRAATTTAAAQKEYPKLAPYSAIRWKGNAAQIQVELDDPWLGLAAIDDVEMRQIVAFAKKTYADEWQRRIGEDLVEVMSKMGHEPGKTVNLNVRSLTANAEIRLKDVPMTHEKRQRVWHARQAEKP